VVKLGRLEIKEWRKLERGQVGSHRMEQRMGHKLETKSLQLFPLPLRDKN